MLAELHALAQVDADALVQRITCPTLVIGMQRDRLFPPAGVRDLAGRLADGSVTIMPKFAHAFPREAIEVHTSPFLG